MNSMSLLYSAYLSTRPFHSYNRKCFGFTKGMLLTSVCHGFRVMRNYGFKATRYSSRKAVVLAWFTSPVYIRSIHNYIPTRFCVERSSVNMCVRVCLCVDIIYMNVLTDTYVPTYLIKLLNVPERRSAIANVLHYYTYKRAPCI